MRLLLAALALTVVTACSGSGDDPGKAGPATPTTPSPSATPAPASAPTELDCDEPERQMTMFDYGGDRSFTRMLTVWTAELGRPYVDRAHRTIWFLREDGRAHTALTWTRAPGAENGREWFVDGYEQCRDAGRATSLGLPAGTPVELEVGHCWVEPVDVDGRTWDVVREDQFGSGGGRPRAVDGTGTLHAAGDVMVYVDEAGGRLTLVPESDPWTISFRGCR